MFGFVSYRWKTRGGQEDDKTSSRGTALTPHLALVRVPRTSWQRRAGSKGPCNFRRIYTEKKLTTYFQGVFCKGGKRKTPSSTHTTGDATPTTAPVVLPASGTKLQTDSLQYLCLTSHQIGWKSLGFLQNLTISLLAKIKGVLEVWHEVANQPCL